MTSDNAKTITPTAREVKKIARTTKVQQYLVDKGVTCRESSLVGWFLGAAGEKYKKLFEEDNWMLFTYP